MNDPGFKTDFALLHDMMTSKNQSKDTSFNIVTEKKSTAATNLKDTVYS